MGDFEVDGEFEEVEDVPGRGPDLEFGPMERYYKRLMADMLRDGELSTAEQERLGEVATSLDLDAANLDALSKALVGDYRARHGVEVRIGPMPAPCADEPDDDYDFHDYDDIEDLADEALAGAVPAPVPQPAGVGTAASAAEQFVKPVRVVSDDRNADTIWESQVLSRRVNELEGLVDNLRRELSEARSRAEVRIEVPVPASELPEHKTSAQASVSRPATATVLPGANLQLTAQIWRDPRDATAVRGLFEGLANDNDRRYCVAQALALLGDSSADVRAVIDAGQSEELPHPKVGIDDSVWRRLITHAQEDALIGEIFSMIVAPVLLGHVSAKRRAGTIVDLDPNCWVSAESSDNLAAQCFNWAAKIFGMKPPLLYRDEQFDGVVRLAPGMPPALRLGNLVMSGERSNRDLAFVAGRWMAALRRDRFMHLLFPDVANLESLFLAALSIGNPEMPLRVEQRRRVQPLAHAIGRFLDEDTIAGLRAGFARFTHNGGRADLARWSFAAECTATRAGLLLSDDLQATVFVLRLSESPRFGEIVDDLIAYCCSTHYSALRRLLGIALH